MAPLAEQFDQERSRRAARHQTLVAVLRRLLRRCDGGKVVATTLRRLLRMAGLDPNVAELACAVLELGGRYARVSPSKVQRDWRRAFVGVVILPDQLARVATIVGGHWEQQLRCEGLVPEPKRSRHLEGGTARDEALHLATRAAVAGAVQGSLSVYLELRAGEISTEDQAALFMFIEGASERDIATKLGLAYETVRDRLTRHKTRAGLALPPRLRRARKYLEEHTWGADEGSERAIWERFCGGDGYRSIARALRIDWRTVVAVLQKHRIRAGIELT